jgi:hypothetical protein
MNWLYLLFVDVNIKQWAAVLNDNLLATVSWAPHGGRSESLIAAVSDAANIGETQTTEALTQLLLNARRALSNQSKLLLEYPAGEMTEAFRAAGFMERRTLLWMRADPATRRHFMRS